MGKINTLLGDNIERITKRIDFLNSKLKNYDPNNSSNFQVYYISERAFFEKELEHNKSLLPKERSQLEDAYRDGSRNTFVSRYNENELSETPDQWFDEKYQND